VDDAPENQQLLYEMLKNDYEVFSATDGKAALKMAELHQPDLILLDVMMPEMDGFEVCRALKDHDELKYTPVMFLTALADEPSELLGFAIGAVDYITKPFKTMVVKQRIANHLKHKQQLAPSFETDVYAKFIPSEFINLLGAEGIKDVKPGGHVERRMTIMFCDIRDFTAHSEKMIPSDAFGYVNSFLSKAASEIHSSNGFVDKYIGDGVLALFPNTPEEGVKAASKIMEALSNLNKTRGSKSRPTMRIGLGMNTGMAMLGTVGAIDRLSTTVISDAVNLAARLESLTKIYGTELIISESTLYALKDPSAYKVRFLDRIKVKGKYHPQSIYEVFENDAHELMLQKEATKNKFEEAAAYYHLQNIEKARILFEECLILAPEDKPAQLYLERCHLFEREGVHEGSGELDGTLEWSKEFEVGVDSIDRQHQELLANINKLAPLIRQGDTSKTEELLKFLKNYAAKHFHHEEALMTECVYPFFIEHINEHKRFINYFLTLQNEILSGEYDSLFLIFKAQIFLADWFAHHTTVMDKHLSKYLFSEKSGRWSTFAE
jgi:hemerythrin